MTQYARARTWLASAKDDWLLPLTKSATEELIAEHDELVRAIRASEAEYDEEVEQSDASCPACTLGCIPIRKPKTCAHHLRVAILESLDKQ